jgi:hypothetical protein
VHGVDFYETAAPVATTLAFRMLIAIAVTRKLTVETFDVDAAFLNSPIEETVFVQIPPGMEVPADFAKKHSGEAHCLRLLKTLYGIKQAARAWHGLLRKTLVDMGYKPLDASDCAFFLERDGYTSMLVIHVDDVAHAHNSDELSRRLKNTIRNLWGLSGEGEIKFFLGMQIDYRVGEYARIYQRTYLEAVLKRFDMMEAHPRGTPMETTIRISKDDSPKTPNDDIRTQYQQILGSLLFAGIMTRPDLANACAQLGRVMSSPGQLHLDALKRVLRYVKGTLDKGIQFTNKDWTPPGSSTAVPALTLVGFSDSDWAGSADDRTSTSGFILMAAGGPLSWKSKGQRIQALSSAEAEYIALTVAAKEIVYARGILSELGILDSSGNGTTTLFCDSTAAISIAQHSGIRDATKHIALRRFFLRTLVESRQIKIEKVCTKLNVADFLTKALPADDFSRHREASMVDCKTPQGREG